MTKRLGFYHSLSTKRAKYYHAIFIYKQRRQELRKKYNFSFSSKNPEYNIAVLNINKRILYWGKRIVDIDKKSAQIKKLNNAIWEFTGYNLRTYKKRCYDDVKVAKAIYYKYGLENGMQPVHLRNYINDKREAHPTEYRTWLTRSFSSNANLKKMYYNFRKYYETEKMQMLGQAKINSLHTGSTNFSILTPKPT